MASIPESDNRYANRPPSETAAAGRDARPGRPMGLQAQFQIALGGILLLFCVVAAVLIYVHEKELLEETALEKSHIVMAAVESTRAYVREVLRPRMYEFAGPDAFVMEAMSTSYVTRAAMERFNDALPSYHYRRVAVNARNPASLPTPVERELIDYFRRYPEKTYWRGIRNTDDGVGFIHARPVVMEASCLKCHGQPSDAPGDLVDIYGGDRGFGYRAGQLAGVTAVGIPVKVALKKIRSRALSVFWVTLLLFLFVYVLISFLFDRMVVRSLRGLLNVFRQGLMSEEEMALLSEASNKVEIDELTDAAQDLTTHLKVAREKLAQYAEDLEQRVAERTRDLEASRLRLHDKVETRNRELKTLNRISELITQSFKLADILPAVLEETLDLIPARGAAIYLLTDGEAEPRLVRKSHRNGDQLDRSIPAADIPSPGQPPSSLTAAIWTAARGEMSHFACQRNHQCLNVPLSCRDRVLGVMTFVDVDLGETPAEMRSLLMSIGQQIGITVESLQNVAELLKNKELLQLVFDGIPDIMVLMNRDLSIRMVNRAYLDHHGVDLETVLGRRCGALDHGCDCPLMSGEQLSRALETGRQTQEEVRTDAGAIFRVYYYPISDASGRVQRIIRYAKDITLEKQVEQRIQQTEKLAAIGQLAAGVAHEINNPMGIILCYADLLKRQAGKAERMHQDIDVIEKQAGNCQRIVSDLLNFSRGKKGEQRPADINAAVNEVVHMVRQQFRKRGTVIETDLRPDMPMILFDIDQVKQVFLNLLMNAHQAMDGGKGHIRIETRITEDKNHAAIRISDDGAGIPPEVADRIFDPFFSTKKTGEGTGLGLSVSYGIIADHGGDIRMTSAVGQGTEFTVTLPIEPGPAFREGK